MLSDEQLVAGCIKGEEKSRRLLYRQYSPMLYGIALRYTKTEADAQDVLQEAFISIFDNMTQYNGKGKLLAWMNKIVVNQALKLYHKQKNRDKIFDTYDEHEIHLKDDFMVNSDWLTHKILLDFIHQLPEGYRMVFNLCEIEGYSYEEVSKLLGCTTSTCRSQLFKAKQTLKKKVLDFRKKEEK